MTTDEPGASVPVEPTPEATAQPTVPANEAWYDLYDRLLADHRSGCTCAGRSKPCPTCIEWADGLEAGLTNGILAAGDLTPGARPELPEGVEPVAWTVPGRYDDERSLPVLLGRDVPEGWETRGSQPGWREFARRTPDGAYVARPVEPPSPATERVPWWEAAGRVSARGDDIVSVKHCADGEPFAVTATGGVIRALDGTIEVLSESTEDDR